MPLNVHDQALLEAWRNLKDARAMQYEYRATPTWIELMDGMVRRAEDSRDRAMVAAAEANRPRLPRLQDGPDAGRLHEAHLRIANTLPSQRAEAMRRASRSYSAADTCVKYDGCTLDGSDVVWPDGERWPARSC